MEPLISVIIPAYNASKTLSAAIESVLCQDVRPIEIIVVDDASVDHTLEVARTWMAQHDFIQVVHQLGNGGASRARNLGLGISLAPYVCFLDADDEYAPGFLSATLQVLRNQPDVAAVSTAVEIVNQGSSAAMDLLAGQAVQSFNDLNKAELTNLDPSVALAKTVEGSLPSNLLIRKEALLLIGGFASTPFLRRYGSEDVLMRRLLRTYFKCVHLPQQLYRHILYGGSNHLNILAKTRLDWDQQTDEFYGNLLQEHTTLRDATGRRMQQVLRHSQFIPAFIDWHFTLAIHAVDWQQLDQQFQTIPGTITALEGYLLYHWAQQGPGDGSVVELGTVNRSLCWLASGTKAAQRGQVTHCGPYDPTLTELQTNLQQMALGPWVEMRLGTLEEISRHWPRSQAIRLLSVDAGHSYEEMRLALTAWFPHVEPGGMMALHGIGVASGCSQCYNELLQFNPQLEEIASVSTIRLVRKPFCATALSLPPSTDEVKQQSRTWVLRGHWYRSNGDMDAALQCYQQSLACNPLEFESLMQLGSYCFSQQQLDQAESYYRRAATAAPTVGSPYNNLAMVLSKQGRLAEAIDCYQQAIKQEPQQILFHLNLADSYYRQNRCDSAESCYRHALAMDPNSVNVLNRFGFFLGQQQRLDEAIEYFQRALTLQPNHGETKLYLGLLRDQQRKKMDRLAQMIDNK
ncbi:MAG: tetratricopeptide repeat protein [Magnetococcales bacterium]|nr:tetratricopeptide repeat protein [Magnetococcales bacterium]